jgi:hypothetical protein
MKAFFIYNNLKVDTWQLRDAPFPGFELLTWDHESAVKGTLWDIGFDAGYTPIGIQEISGQIWLCETWDRIRELENYLGVNSGLTEAMMTKANIRTPDVFASELDVSIYRIKEIKSKYQIVHDGKWNIKRG